MLHPANASFLFISTVSVRCLLIPPVLWRVYIASACQCTADFQGDNMEQKFSDEWLFDCETETCIIPPPLMNLLPPSPPQWLGAIPDCKSVGDCSNYPVITSIISVTNIIHITSVIIIVSLTAVLVLFMIVILLCR